MTIEDIEEYEKNAVEILRKHDQFATARAVETAFSALVCLKQFKWERDIAISQLEELGLSLGQKVDHVQNAINSYKKIPEIIEELKKEVYHIDDSATLLSRDVINEEDVFEALESLLG